MSDDTLHPTTDTPTDPTDDLTGDPTGDPAAREAEQQAALDALVGDWLDWKQAAAELGVTVSKVRQLIRERQLCAAVPRPRAGQQVPAALLMDGEIVKGVPGLLTVLGDGGYSDREIMEYLFTPDDSLPGRPIDALRENRGSEVKRRAQAMSL